MDFAINKLMIYTYDFFFHILNERKKLDALVVFNPMDAKSSISPLYLRSKKTLQEHIDYINQNNIKKVIAVAENIDFLNQCPGIECLRVFPADSVKNFDFSPVYGLPNLKWLCCHTTYGENEEMVSSVDYKDMNNLECLLVVENNGHLNVNQVKSLETLDIINNYPGADALSGFIPQNIKSLEIILSTIKSLDGIEFASNLQCLRLDYNRRISDISALCFLKDSLRVLNISTCGKIKDFSVLKELHKLEYLTLSGTNILTDLSFLKKMPNLKNFVLRMNVEDGDLSLCENIPYVSIKNRKHFSHKDSDFKKDYTDFDDIDPF